MKKTYPSDLTNREWNHLKKHLPRRKNHPSLKWSWPELLKAIFYLQRTGCQWNHLPDSFPPFLIPRRT